MKLSLSLKTLAWSWGVLLTTCAAGAVALQVVDVVPSPEAPPVLQAPGQVAFLPPPPLYPAAAAAAPVVAAAKPEPEPAVVEPPRQHPPRQAAELPLPPVPPRVRETREVRNWRYWRRPVVRAYASEPQWRQPAGQPYWRGSPYPGQYYAYSEPGPRVQQPPSYYPWPPAE